MKVRGAMNTSVRTVTPDTKSLEVASLMTLFQPCAGLVGLRAAAPGRSFPAACAKNVAGDVSSNRRNAAGWKAAPPEDPESHRSKPIPTRPTRPTRSQALLGNAAAKLRFACSGSRAG